MEIELTGTYPIIIGGENTGQVNISREGLFWVFEAKCAMQEELVRLSVYGDGREGYLGVMSPEGEGLTLQKKLSRTAVAEFPSKIEFAGLKGQPPPVPESGNGGQKESETQPESEAISENTVPQEVSIPPPDSGNTPLINEISKSFKYISPQSETIMPEFVRTSPPVKTEPETNWRSCPLPCSLFTDIEAKSVTGGIRGAMSCTAEDCTRLAVPLSEAHAIGRRSILRFNESAEIGGTTYVVCKIRNGRPI
jgi:hypothetical protein